MREAAFPVVMSLLVACTAPGPTAADGGKAAGDGAVTGTAADAAPDASPAVLDAAPACSLAPGSPQKQALFTTASPELDYSIEDEIVAMAEAAAAGSRIRVAIFTWTRMRVANALIGAHERGVDVGVIVDERNIVEDPESSGSWRLRKPVAALADALGDGLIICNADIPPDGGGCIGDKINHNKLALFSELCDGSENVVVQSSANFTKSQLRKHNNAVIIRDDPDLFAGYESYWNDMAAQEQDPNYYRKVDGAGVRAIFYPRAGTSPETDTVYKILNGIGCGAQSRVRIAMSIWTPGRRYLIDALGAVESRGCDVAVVVSSGVSDEIVSDLESAIGPGDVRTKDGVHHKYLLVDDHDGGDRRRIVWTGSHNYSHSALRRNDETILRVEDEEVFDAFLSDWKQIWAAAQ